ncbi:hypothetical protein L2E82_44014 [Cichorium intybus]|uniref:Uncharacterized protein n=1 Tax=Cichorium intybus TaxID=13427 RepID=A0ACB8ZQK0_CICIN|nr:hypothetical protein L2E82_44014 [Cichorium intybus]
MDPEMDSYEEDNRTYKARELYVLSDKIEELHKTKEELKQAKDEAMQSWLDSRPIIDELKRLQLELAKAKEESENNMLVTKLESELMAINMEIRVKKEEELKSRTEINEMTQVSESVRAEMEKIKLEINEGRRERSKLKMVVKMKRQSLRTVNLTLRVVRLEVEAYSATAEATLEQIGRGKVSDDTTTDDAPTINLTAATIDLTQEEYFALMRRAKEETSLADWRVVVATEQRLEAEESCDLTLKRLNNPTLIDVAVRKRKEVETFGNEVLSSKVKPRAQTPFPRGQSKMAHGEMRRDSSRRQVGIKKRSVFVQIKSFFARKIKYLFG